MGYFTGKDIYVSLIDDFVYDNCLQGAPTQSSASNLKFATNLYEIILIIYWFRWTGKKSQNDSETMPKPCANARGLALPWMIPHTFVFIRDSHKRIMECIALLTTDAHPKQALVKERKCRHHAHIHALVQIKLARQTSQTNRVAYCINRSRAPVWSCTCLNRSQLPAAIDWQVTLLVTVLPMWQLPHRMRLEVDTFEWS